MTSFTPALRMNEGGDPMPRLEPPEGLKRMKLWRGEEFAFEDLIDFVNPLQHIPIVGDIYRAVTGDKPGALSQLTVGGILGGPLGFVGSAIGVALQTETGKSTGELALSLFDGVGEDSAEFAQADTPRADRLHRQGMSDRASDIAWESDAAITPLFAFANSGTAGDAPRPDSARPDPAKLDGVTLDTSKVPTARPMADAAAAQAASRPVSVSGKRTALQDAAIPPAARQAMAGRAAAPVTMGRVDPTAALLAAQAKTANPVASMMQALDKYEALKTMPAAPRSLDVVN